MITYDYHNLYTIFHHYRLPLVTITHYTLPFHDDHKLNTIFHHYHILYTIHCHTQSITFFQYNTLSTTTSFHHHHHPSHTCIIFHH
jgi:hypothetical protein